MRYVSTRGAAPTLDFRGVTLAGLASDGGLYVPEVWPTLTQGEIAALGGLSYVETAVREGLIGYEESGVLLSFYEDVLNGYTYLEQ